jgi:hypothetical protein
MLIALDHDGTITADPILWSLFVSTAKHRGHEVVIVTYRFPQGNNQDVEKFAADHDVKVIYTGGKQKASMIDADIWIDDMPQIIPTPSILRGMLVGCRKNNET